jgi:CheY-like chemotaxis protein
MDLSRAMDQTAAPQSERARSGNELCRWIRSRSDLPVVMLTASATRYRIAGLEDRSMRACGPARRACSLVRKNRSE